MIKVVVGTLSIMLGTMLLIDSIPGITGYVIVENTGFNLLSFLGLIFLICGLVLFVLEARNAKVIKAKKLDKK